MTNRHPADEAFERGNLRPVSEQDGWLDEGDRYELRRDAFRDGWDAHVATIPRPGWIVVLRPDGRFAVWSEIAEGFVVDEATPTDIVDVYRARAIRAADNEAAAAMRACATDYVERHRRQLNRARREHGLPTIEVPVELDEQDRRGMEATREAVLGNEPEGSPFPRATLTAVQDAPFVEAAAALEHLARVHDLAAAIAARIPALPLETIVGESLAVLGLRLVRAS